jgi:hypothetical protein
LEYHFLTFYKLSTKEFEIKTSPLSRAIFGRSPRPPKPFLRVGVSDPRRKKVAAVLYRRTFVRAAGV